MSGVPTGQWCTISSGHRRRSCTARKIVHEKAELSAAQGPVESSFYVTGRRENVEQLESEGPITLPDTASVLSLGRVCLKHGYNYTWPAVGTPYFQDRKVL